MLMGSTERLERWTALLDARIQEAEAELARPLCSPWLRCACGVFQAARLGLVVRDGVMVAAAGVALVRRAVQAGDLSGGAQAGRAGAAASRIVMRAGFTASRAVFIAATAALRAARRWRTS